MDDKEHGDDRTVNRYAFDQLPPEVQLISDWVHGNVDVICSEWSEWTEQEQARLRPGFQVLVELVDGELDDARDELDAIRQAVTTDARTFLEQKLTCANSIAAVERDQASMRRDIQATLRGYFADVVELARAFGGARRRSVDAASRRGGRRARWQPGRTRHWA